MVGDDELEQEGGDEPLTALRWHFLFCSALKWRAAWTSKSSEKGDKNRIGYEIYVKIHYNLCIDRVAASD